MTFAHEESGSTTASPTRVFEVWSDVTTWPSWNPPVESAVLSGPFRVGSTGTVTLTGGLDARLEVVEVSPDRCFVDVLRMGELEIRVEHTVEQDGGDGGDGGDTTVTVLVQVDGPGEDDIGALLTADASRTISALCELAEQA